MRRPPQSSMHVNDFALACARNKPFGFSLIPNSLVCVYVQFLVAIITIGPIVEAIAAVVVVGNGVCEGAAESMCQRMRYSVCHCGRDGVGQ